MKGRTHGAWGLLTGVGTAYVTLVQGVPLGVPVHLTGVAVAGLAALVADLDSPESLLQELPQAEGSKMGKRLLRSELRHGNIITIILSAGAALFLWLLGAVLSGLIKIVSLIIRVQTTHREKTHNLVAAAVGGLVAGLVTALVVVVFGMWQDGAIVWSKIPPLLIAPATLRPAAYLGGCCCLGWCSHLFLDMLTPSGVPLFYPFYKGRLHLLSITTGSAGDNVVRWVGDLATGAVVCLYCWNLAGQAQWLAALRRLEWPQWLK